MRPSLGAIFFKRENRTTCGFPFSEAVHEVPELGEAGEISIDVKQLTDEEMLSRLGCENGLHSGSDFPALFETWDHAMTMHWKLGYDAWKEQAELHPNLCNTGMDVHPEDINDLKRDCFFHGDGGTQR